MNIDLTGCKKMCEGVYKKNESTYYILCSVSKAPCYCSGDRLKKLIAKHGSCEKVAGAYVSRDAKRLIKAKIPAKAVMKMDKATLREEATEVQIARERRREERRKRRETKEAIRTKPTMVYHPVSSSHYDLTEPSVVAKLTKEVCLLPNRFLDNNNTCDKCGLKANCLAPMKFVFSERKTKGKKAVACS